MATESTYGISSGEADLNNPASTYLPILRAASIASSGGGSRAAVTGVQGFTYNGPAATTITLNLNLDAFLDRTAPGTPEASARTDVAVFFTNSLLPFTNDYPTVRFEIGAGSFRGDESNLIATMPVGVQGDVSISDTISFDVVPGDQFVVWAGLRTAAERGGIADVSNTFTMTFEDDTGLTASGAPDAPVGGLDHFKCYKAHGHDNLDVSVDLDNQFGATTAEVEEAELFCNPVDKNGEGVFDDTVHLTGYGLDDDDHNSRRRVATISNQFGDEQVLVLKGPKYLFVPSEMDAIPSDLNLDYFKCDRARRGEYIGEVVSLEDTFSSVSAWVKKPRLFCSAVNKDGEGIMDESAHLACYAIKADRANRGVYVMNGLPDNQWLGLKRSKFLCVPSDLLAVETRRERRRHRHDDDDD